MRRDDEKAGRVEERKGGRRGKRWLVKAVGRGERRKARKREDAKTGGREDGKGGRLEGGKSSERENGKGVIV